jgi:hypothetical protein
MRVKQYESRQILANANVDHRPRSMTLWLHETGRAKAGYLADHRQVLDLALRSSDRRLIRNRSCNKHPRLGERNALLLT